MQDVPIQEVMEFSSNILTRGIYLVSEETFTSPDAEDPFKFINNKFREQYSKTKMVTLNATISKSVISAFFPNTLKMISSLHSCNWKGAHILY